MTIPRLFAFVLPFVLGLVPAWAQNELKGLSGVNVGVLLDESVQKQHPDLQQAIQRDVEIKLRVAGMEILSAADLMSKPRITISISTTTTGAGFLLMFALAEPAFLERDKTKRVQAATWVRQGLAFTVNETESRGLIKDMADEFINAWLIANPKPR
jgi:hypothetical protein